MYLHGKFNTERGEEVTVEIVTRRSRVPEIEIGSEESGVFFDADEPVSIDSQMNDTFDHLLRKSATVRLQAVSLLTDLYCENCLDAVVNIRRDGECVFAGYIEPHTYGQEFNSVYDDLEINCVDAISALQYINYREVGTAGVSYDQVKAGAGQVTFQTLLLTMFGHVTDGLDLTRRGVATLRYDGSVTNAGADIWSTVSVNDLLFMGDTEEDIWTCDRVMEEVLRYLNLHMTQTGLELRIFSWETLRGEGEVTWHPIVGTGDVTEGRKVVTITTANVASDDTTISIGEVYNQLALTCNVTEIENIVESPLEESSMKSPYRNMQKYMTEYMAEGDGETAQKAFYSIIAGKPYDYDSAATTDWYVQVQDSLQWRFWGEGVDLVATLCASGTWQNHLPDYLGKNPGAALISFGSVTTRADRSDNAPVSRVDMTTSLVVSVNGNGKDTEGSAYPTAESLLAASPVAEYTGNVSGGVFSPVDDDTTNYIVISGKVVLNPLREVSCEPVYPITDIKTVPSKNNGDGRLLTQRFWKCETPGSEPVENTGTVGLLPFTGEVPGQYEFKYSAIGDSTDKVSKVAVLACMLVIGDKCVVESGTDGNPGDYTWRPFKERSQCATDDEYYAQCFTIGFDPKIGDRLIGQEFDVQNNITFKMGIDAEGTAIPIRKSDKVSGRVRFMILGPVNTTWGEVTRRHPTWFRHTKWGENEVPLMAHVSAIYVNEFEVKVYSDNSKVNNTDDCDLVYMSDTDESYLNKKDDLTFRFTTALTAEEREALELTDSVKLSTPLSTLTGNGLTEVSNTVTGETGKPEQLYVDAYWREYHTPRVLMTQKFDERSGVVGMLNHYTHPALPGKSFYVTGISRALMEGYATLTLKER